ncbi:hypothetical protein [Chlamydiifrater phoenicopteri]|uniref:hypothetical protein n=1 Tax=Chlamydiifrater phoenicopteri TaxID=2681469 RepID=UPI001BCDB687|nr:hypothetical protein [Chlamydiifrater phoenicopteri]
MISIQRCLRPYSLVPGDPIAIPGSLLYAKVFPTLVQIFNADREKIFEEPISIYKPLKRFGVFQDLHKGVLQVVTDQYKYYLLPSGEKVDSLKSCKESKNSQGTLLSLGMHKQLDLSRVRRRGDLKEIIPVLFRLGVLLGREQEKSKLLREASSNEGVYALLGEINEQIALKKHDVLGQSLRNFCFAGFSETLLPRLYDDSFLGIIPSPSDTRKFAAPIPFLLYWDLFLLVSSMLVRMDGDVIRILPTLLPDFPCGRCLEIPLPGIGVCHLEWTKKRVRRMEIQCQEESLDKKITLIFSSDIRHYRLREISRQGGSPISSQTVRKNLGNKKVLKAGETLALKSGNSYLLDCFHQ